MPPFVLYANSIAYVCVMNRKRNFYAVLCVQLKKKLETKTGFSAQKVVADQFDCNKNVLATHDCNLFPVVFSPRYVSRSVSIYQIKCGTCHHA